MCSVYRKPVVVLAKNDYAGIMWKLRCAINRHSHKYYATHIAFDRNQFNYPIEVIGDEYQSGFINQMLSEAACIIMKDYDIPGYMLPPNIRLDPKKSIWYGVGANYRHLQADRTFDKYRFRMVSTPDMIYRPDDIYLPAPFDTEKYIRIADRDYDPITIMHSPSNPEQKGTNIISAAVNKICCSYPFVHFSLTGGAPNNIVMEMKENADIFIDQIGKNQILGYNSIEAASFGAAVVTDTSQDNDNPAIHASRTTLYSVLEGLVTDPSKIDAAGKEMRSWVVRTHGYRSVMELLEPYIDEIVEG